MSYYARGTEVSPEKTQAEIVQTLIRYKASDYMTGWASGSAVVGFKLDRRCIRISVKMPDQVDKAFGRARNRILPQMEALPAGGELLLLPGPGPDRG